MALKDHGYAEEVEASRYRIDRIWFDEQGRCYADTIEVTSRPEQLEQTRRARQSLQQFERWQVDVHRLDGTLERVAGAPPQFKIRNRTLEISYASDQPKEEK